jgi:heptosyltransferase I
VGAPDDAPRYGIVMLSALGDAVHVLAIASAIKRARPGARVSWVMQPGLAPFVAGHPAVDETIVFERAKGLRGYAELGRGNRRQRFDAVLVLQPYLKSALVARLLRADVRIGLGRDRARDLAWLLYDRRLPRGPVKHIQDTYAEFLAPLGVPHEPVVWDVGPWEHERAWQREFFSTMTAPAAAIVVGTSKPQKDWPAERWAEVVDRLHEEHGLQAVLVGGRSPRELAAEAVITARARHRPVSALGSGLRKLVAILDGAALVLSPDTGPLHLAVALDRPVVSLVGYSHPGRVGPYRRFHDLLIDAYHDPGEPPTPPSMAHRSGRMERITVEQVMEKARVWAARYRDASR